MGSAVKRRVPTVFLVPYKGVPTAPPEAQRDATTRSFLSRITAPTQGAALAHRILTILRISRFCGLYGRFGVEASSHNSQYSQNCGFALAAIVC